MSESLKMGQIAVDLATGGFVLAAPEGPRAVTLRCRHDGVVCVEEVAGGGMSVQPLRIQQISLIPGQATAKGLRA